MLLKTKEWKKKLRATVNGFDYDRFANYIFYAIIHIVDCIKMQWMQFVCRNKFVVWLITKVVRVKRFFSVVRITVFSFISPISFRFLDTFRCRVDVKFFPFHMLNSAIHCSIVKTGFSPYLSAREKKKTILKINFWYQTSTRDYARRCVLILSIFPAPKWAVIRNTFF